MFAAVAVRVEPIMARATDTVVPIIVPDNRRNPQVIGSAVLLRLAEQPFLLTAAHVADRGARGGLEVGARERIVPLGGRYFHTTPPDGGRAADRFDLAVFPLSDAVAADLGAPNFLGPDELRWTERPHVQSTPAGTYLLTGFPSSKQPRQPKSDGEFVVRPYQPLVQASELDRYESLQVHPDSHLALALDRSDLQSLSGPKQAPDLHGMSGGGVWRIDHLIGAGEPRAHLVGIMVEYHDSPSHVLLATRIGVALQLIQDEFPSLGTLIRLLI
jgi:hypothetical protein